MVLLMELRVHSSAYRVTRKIRNTPGGEFYSQFFSNKKWQLLGRSRRDLSIDASLGCCRENQLPTGCLRYTKLCWVGKHIPGIIIIMKPSNSPTQGQPNPRKIGFKVAFWATFFPQRIVFRGLGLVLYRKQTTRNLTRPNYPQNTLLLKY